MEARQFRFVAFAGDFARTVEFYEGKLGMRRLEDWDRDDGKGVLLSAGGNAVVEVLGAAGDGIDRSRAGVSGVMLALEVDSADEWRSRLDGAGVECSPLEDRPWGHRDFSTVDPDGVVVAIYHVI